MNTNVYVELEFEGNHFLEVRALADFKLVNDGIGSYEFWGQKGYDSMIVNELQDFSVFDNKDNDITKKLNQFHLSIIESKIEDELVDMSSEDYIN